MEIIYKNTKEFTKAQLEDLFLSVDWSSGHYPEKLVVAMSNFETVISAWDGNRLVGLICVLDDGIMTAYVHYLLVNPAYQGKHIGSALVKKIKAHYKDYLRIVLMTYDKGIAFYEDMGFTKAEKYTPMLITSLWT